MRITSCLLSLLFHLLVLFIALYFPFQGVKNKIDLDKQVYKVELYQLPQAKKNKEIKDTESTEKQSEKSGKSPPAQKKIKPAKVPASKKNNALTPEPKARPTKIAKKKQASPPPKVDKEKKRSGHKTRKTKPQKVPTQKNVVSKALDDIKKDVHTKDKKQTSIVDQELASLRNALDNNRTTAYGTQYGKNRLTEIYGHIVEQEIKENWRFPMVDSDLSLQAKVEIHVNSKGNITDWQLIKKSGRTDFDTSVLRAVEETRSLPSPPEKDLQLIEITFNLQDRRRF